MIFVPKFANLPLCALNTNQVTPSRLIWIKEQSGNIKKEEEVIMLVSIKTFKSFTFAFAIPTFHVLEHLCPVCIYMVYGWLVDRYVWVVFFFKFPALHGSQLNELIRPKIAMRVTEELTARFHKFKKRIIQVIVHQAGKQKWDSSVKTPGLQNPIYLTPKEYLYICLPQLPLVRYQLPAQTDLCPLRIFLIIF